MISNNKIINNENINNNTNMNNKSKLKKQLVEFSKNTIIINKNKGGIPRDSTYKI